MELAQAIAERVFFERKSRKWSRIALAEQAGVGKTVIWDIEHAKPTVRLQTLIQVCAALRLDLQLVGGAVPVGESERARAPVQSEPAGSQKQEFTVIAAEESVVDELPDHLL